MSSIEQLQTHILYTSLPTCLESLALLQNDETFITKLDEYGIQTINRIDSTLKQLKVRINSIDPLLLRKSILDQLHNSTSQINTYLSNYSTYFVNTTHLTTINGQIDNILAYLITIPQIIDSDSVETLRETVTSFRRSVIRHKTVLEQQQEELKSKKEEIVNGMEELNTSFEQLDEKFDSSYTEFETKFNSLYDELLLSEQKRNDQFEQRLDDFQQAFDDKLKEQNLHWEQLNSEHKQKIEDTINQLNEIQQDFINQTKLKQKTYDELLETHKKSVESLVGIISTNSISGHFKEVADKKEKLIARWQWFTIGGFLITILFGIYAFIISEGIDWTSIVSRTIVTAGLGTFTAYAARQASKYEIQERYNRKMEVELKTLNPYIASFSEEDQIKLKEQLFPHIFGKAKESNQELESSSKISKELSQQDIINLTSLIEIFRKTINNNNKDS